MQSGRPSGPFRSGLIGAAGSVGSVPWRIAEDGAIIAPLLAGLAEEMWTIGGINVVRVPAGLTHERSAADDPRAAVLALYDPGLNPRVHVAPPSCSG